MSDAWQDFTPDYSGRSVYRSGRQATRERINVRMEAHFRGVYRYPLFPLPPPSSPPVPPRLSQARAEAFEVVLDKICTFAIARPLDIRYVDVLCYCG